MLGPVEVNTARHNPASVHSVLIHLELDQSICVTPETLENNPGCSLWIGQFCTCHINGAGRLLLQHGEATF